MLDNKLGIRTLLYQLLSSPIKAIKGIQLIDYEKDEMDRFYYFASIILGSISICVNSDRGYIGLLFIGLVAFPFSSFINRWIISFIHYVLFKFVGKIEITFEIVKTVLYPVIVLLFLIGWASIILFANMTIVIAIVGVLSYVWFKLIVFWIMIYKMKQTPKKSIILSLILVCFDGFIYIFRIIML